jgi:hypothetical protein
MHQSTAPAEKTKFILENNAQLGRMQMWRFDFAAEPSKTITSYCRRVQHYKQRTTSRKIILKLIRVDNEEHAISVAIPFFII